MGRDKARLERHGQPLWRAQVETLGALQPARLMIACREEQGLDQEFKPGALEVEWLFDPPGEDCGPIAAIGRGLRRAGLPMLVLPVDAPLVTAAWIRHNLLREWPFTRGRFFRAVDRYEPLISLYTPQMLPLLEEALSLRQHSLQRLVERAIDADLANAVALSPQDAVLFAPANTPEEWTRQSAALEKAPTASDHAGGDTAGRS
jgi:molybdopterin-guanine dinucleotide biosynthesis protein A